MMLVCRLVTRAMFGCSGYANVYGLGRNETLVGEAINGRREKVILATKFGIVRDANGHALGVNGHPEYDRKSFEESVKRLGVYYIDLYYQHQKCRLRTFRLNTVGEAAG